MLLIADYNEDKLLLSLAQGEMKSFEEIFNRHWSSLFDSAYRRLNNKEQCKDIVQDVFADLWIRRGTVQIENLGAYLHAAVRFQVFRLASRNRLTTFVELFETIASSPFGADNLLVDKELEDIAQSWIDSLPEKRRQIFLLHFRENLTTKEIAERLQISQKTAQNQLGRAAQYLRDQMIRSAAIFLYLGVLLK